MKTFKGTCRTLHSLFLQESRLIHPLTIKKQHFIFNKLFSLKTHKMIMKQGRERKNESCYTMFYYTYVSVTMYHTVYL